MVNNNGSIFDFDREEKTFPLHGETSMDDFEVWYEMNGYRESYTDNDHMSIAVLMLDGLGDSILASRAIKCIKHKYPNAIISLLCSPQIKELYEACPDIRYSRSINYVNVVKRDPYDPLIVPKVAQEFLSSKFKIAYVFSFGTHANRLAYLIGAKDRYAIKPDISLITESDMNNIRSIQDFNSRYINHFISKPKLHLSKIFTQMVTDSPQVDDSLSVYITHSDLEKIDKLDIPKENLIAVGLSAGEPGKIYHRYPEVLKLLHERYPDKHFVLLGKNVDIEEYDTSYTTSFINKLSIRENIALLSKCESYIGNDTWFVHAASAMEIPCLVVSPYPSNIPIRSYASIISWAPYGTKNVIVQPTNPNTVECKKSQAYSGCDHMNTQCCILNIEPSTIIKGYTHLLSAKDTKTIFIK